MGVCLSKGKDSKPKHKGYRHSGAARVRKQKAHEPFVKQSKTPTHKPYRLPEKHAAVPPQAWRKPSTTSPSSSPRPVDKILGKPFEDVKQFYALGKELGRGKFGVTYICTENSTGLRYACKSISKRKIVRRADKEDIKREVQIMQHLSGQPNIVEFKGAYEDELRVHVVMELCAGGDLFDRIVAKGHYSERDAASICRQIVNVVRICHFKGVMHRDLKPENFLLSSKDENALLKATDFGLSVFIEQETEKGVFDEILKGRINFESDPRPSISNSAKDLVRKMLTQDPTKRITSAQVLEYPWIRGEGNASDKPIDTAVL